MTKPSFSARQRAHNINVCMRWTFCGIAVLFALVYGFGIWHFTGHAVFTYPDHESNSTGIVVTTPSPVRLISYVHVSSGSVWFLIAALQLWPSFRVRHISAHKTLGKVGVAVALISAFSSIAMCIAGGLSGGPLMKFGAPLFALLWVHAMFRGILAIKQGRVVAHEAYMRRAYALSWAIIGIRMLVVIPRVLGYDLASALDASSGIAWIVALVGVEYYNRSQPQELQPTPFGKGLRVAPDLIIPTREFIQAQIVERRALIGVHDIAIISLQLSGSEHAHSVLATPPGCHYTLRATVGNKQTVVTRPYTPVAGLSQALLDGIAEPSDVAVRSNHDATESVAGEVEEGGKVTLFVRRYEAGAMSRFLHDSALGTTVELLGPIGSYRLARNQYESMVMLAAGTGITPILSVARVLIEDKDDRTSISLIWQTNGRAEAYRAMVEGLCGKRVKATFTSKHQDYADVVEKVGGGESPGKNVGVVVCGPKPFMDCSLEMLKRAGYRRINIHCFGFDDM
jgi:uncharacterized membrane protein